MGPNRSEASMKPKQNMWDGTKRYIDRSNEYGMSRATSVGCLPPHRTAAGKRHGLLSAAEVSTSTSDASLGELRYPHAFMWSREAPAREGAPHKIECSRTWPIAACHPAGGRPLNYFRVRWRYHFHISTKSSPTSLKAHEQQTKNLIEWKRGIICISLQRER